VSPTFLSPPSLDAASLNRYVKTYGASVLELDRSLAAAPAPPDLIDLTHGDTRAFTPPATAAADFHSALAENTEAYTAYRGSSSLRARIAPRLGDLLGRTVDPDRELIVTPGTQGGLFAVLSALVSSGDRVALPDPEYFMNERILAYLGAVVVRLPIEQDDKGLLSIGADNLAAARAARPRLLLLSHPNNPTGGVYESSTIQALADMAVDEDLIVVVDQLYCRLIYAGAQYTHLGALPGMIERTVTLVGPSKTESMSGYRVGVAVGPPPVVEAMERVVSLASLRAPGYCQQVLRHWAEDDAEWLTRRTAGHQALRDLMVERLRSISGVSVAPPAGSSYMFPLVGSPRWATNGPADDHEIAMAIKAAGVLVSPGYQFGPSGRGRFRINFSQDKKRLLSAAERITSALS